MKHAASLRRRGRREVKRGDLNIALRPSHPGVAAIGGTAGQPAVPALDHDKSQPFRAPPPCCRVLKALDADSTPLDSTGATAADTQRAGEHLASTPQAGDHREAGRSNADASRTTQPAAAATHRSRRAPRTGQTLELNAHDDLDERRGGALGGNGIIGIGGTVANKARASLGSGQRHQRQHRSHP